MGVAPRDKLLELGAEKKSCATGKNANWRSELPRRQAPQELHPPKQRGKNAAPERAWEIVNQDSVDFAKTNRLRMELDAIVDLGKSEVQPKNLIRNFFLAEKSTRKESFEKTAPEKVVHARGDRRQA